MDLEFEWDANKRALNLWKHRIDFEDAIRIFESAVVTKRSDREGEERWVAVGEVDRRVLAVVYTIRDSRYRIISARRARRDEQRSYRKAAPGG
ncbi:MAG TPA: BrnT family toxin [Longimicrobiaceae bacterium]|nr:BrnT family toxin [Longimicrobiaceae bacterium]